MPDQFEEVFREHFKQHYSELGMHYDQLSTAYEFGRSMARDPKWKGKGFEEQQDALRDEFLRRYPEADWNVVENAVLYGWEKGGGEVGGFAFI